MRFYTKQHPFYCGIDLHAGAMYVVIVDQSGQVLLERNVRADAKVFLELIEPYRSGGVAVECIFTSYWLADLCETEGIAFVLGHALYMNAMHGGKVKHDKIDAHKSPACCEAACSPMPTSTPP